MRRRACETMFARKIAKLVHAIHLNRREDVGSSTFCIRRGQPAKKGDKPAVSL